MSARDASAMPGVGLLALLELRRAWRTMVVLGVLAGVGLGVAIASAQAARRTSTAYDRLAAESGSPDAAIIWTSAPDTAPSARIPGVARRWDVRFAIGKVEGPHLVYLSVVAGARPPKALTTSLYIAGHPPDPRADDELVITEELQRLAGLRVGQVLSMAFLTREEVTQFDTGFGEPDGPRLAMRVVGIVRTTLGQGDNAPGAFSTPAFARRMTAAGATYPGTFVTLTNGAAGVRAFERHLDAIGASLAPAPGGEEFPRYVLTVPSRQRPAVALTARVLVTGVLVFGAIAGLAALVAAALALRRHFTATSQPNARALAAIGVTGPQMRTARWIAALPFSVGATVIALGIAVVAGVIRPLGTLRRFEPHPGFHVNVLLVVVGIVAIAVVLAAVAALAAGGLRVRPAEARAGGSRLVNRAAALGAPPPVVIGAGLAVDPGRGRAGSSVRAPLVATALAIAGVVAVSLFASSLHRLVTTPARWGWPADAMVFDVNDARLQVLKNARSIDGIATVNDVQVRIEGRNATGLVYDGAPDLDWTILTGHRPRAAGEVVLGARLARSLGRSVGDRVRLVDKDGKAVSLAVVGTGVGPEQYDGTFGSGMLLTRADAERLARTQFERNAAVAFRPGVDPTRASDALAARVELSRPDRPPDVENLSQLGRMPELLAVFLALLSVTVLAHGLVTSARRRGRELDTLRAIGFRRRQAVAVLVTASLVTVAIGLVVGSLIGVAAAHVLWSFTAHAAYVSGDLAVSVPACVLFFAGAVVVAVLVAGEPAWRLTRRTVAEGLRTE